MFAEDTEYREVSTILVRTLSCTAGCPRVPVGFLNLQGNLATSCGPSSVQLGPVWKRQPLSCSVPRRVTWQDPVNRVGT